MAEIELNVLSLEDYKSKQYLEDGKYHISQGELELALESFQRSVEQKPSCEALTYMGWVMGLKEDYDTAIDLCKRALKINPTYGLALNDIGHYFIQKNELGEAVTWLERAKNAVDLASPHFPHINLGRIYSALGDYSAAIVEFRSALKLCPGHKEIQKVLKELEEIENNA